MKGTFLSAFGLGGRRGHCLADRASVRFSWQRSPKFDLIQNGQIKLLAGPRKLSIDFRFGVNTILNEVINGRVWLDGHCSTATGRTSLVRNTDHPVLRLDRSDKNGFSIKK